MNNTNLLLDAARPIFILTNTMRQTQSRLSTEQLLDKISLMIEQFHNTAEGHGIKHETIHVAKYCLCTFVDEQAVHAKWANENWVQRSLLVSFYKETWGGERFFEILDNLKQHPEANIDLLEMLYLCLQFGYKGKYQVLPNGDLQIDKIKRDLSTIIRHDDLTKIFLLNKHVSHNNLRQPKNKYIPLWLLFIISLISITVSYVIMQRMLAKQFSQTSAQINKLALPITQRTIDSSKINRLSPLLKNEIDRKLVSVIDLPDRSVVTILGDGLFESGSATIQDQYFPVLAVIGQALNSAEGQVIVSGYTDDQPIRGVTFPSNWHLSQGRADAVKEILTKYVTDGATRIRSEGRGETNPVAPNDTAENRAKNRRVEIILFVTGTGSRLGSETQQIVPNINH